MEILGFPYKGEIYVYMLTDTIKTDDGAHWYVMTHLEPAEIDENLRRVRENEGAEAFETYFIPYLFIKRRLADHGAAEADNDAFQGWRDPLEVSENNAIRSELKRYVFIRGTVQQMRALVTADWNRFSRLHLQHYRDAFGREATVPELIMQRFIRACTDQMEKFELRPTVATIMVDTEVVIRRGPFKSVKANVTEVHHTDQGVRLTLSIPFFANSRDIYLTDYTPDMVSVIGDGADIIGPDFIDRIQSKVLSILSRRVHHKETDATRIADARTLSRLYGYRHSTIQDDDSDAIFQSLMLIVARLRFDQEGQTLLQRRVQSLLTGARSGCLTSSPFTRDRSGCLTSPEAAPPFTGDRSGCLTSQTQTTALSPVRGPQSPVALTMLHIALYIATQDPRHRTAAKTLIRDNALTSPHLRRFLSLIRQ